MQLFIIDSCPIKCAKYLDDKRLIKIILESAQVLSTAVNYHAKTHITTYKSTHINHPISIWARETKGNYRWILAYFRALYEEYTRRFKRIHKSSLLYPELEKYVSYIPDGNLTPFKNCTRNQDLNIDFTHIPDVFDAYKQYLDARYKTDKKVAFSTISW